MVTLINGPFDLIIFDCDGVLVDSENLAIEALLGVIAEAGLTLDFDEAHARFLGRSLASICEVLVSDYQLTLTPDALDLMRQRLYGAFLQELEPIAGISATLLELRIPFCVASSSQVERIRLALEVTGLLPAFEGRVFSAAMVIEGKPAPDLFLHAAKSLGAKPSRCLVIEDSPAGVEAAIRAGMTVYGFTGGSHARLPAHQESLQVASPDLIFSDMRLLPGLISAHAPSPNATKPMSCVVAVDVGTASVRAGVFTSKGELISRAEHPIRMNRHGANHAEQDSEDIWRAACQVVRGVLEQADIRPGDVKGIAFDATCSLVVRGKSGEPVSVALSGEDNWDTISWLDHRALKEADECTATGHHVLSFLGGVMSPEMQTPKLMWLKRNLPSSWSKMGYVFDLADFLSWKSTGSTARSQCTLACKWTYLPHDAQPWRQDFFEAVGLGDLWQTHLLPLNVRPVGSAISTLCERAAGELGLTSECIVAAGLIDAYGGTLGVIGAYASSRKGIDRHMALIAGTSSCVTALSGKARPAPGIWGPYLGAALADYWLNEGGQSATGALLDHIIRSHRAGGDPDGAMHQKIAARIEQLRNAEGVDFASQLHVLPDFHGNRSPISNPHALGVISGLTLDSSFDGLCRIYWRTGVSIALGVRHILDALNEHGWEISILHITGGHTKNPILMELYADATGCALALPLAEHATLLGTAMVAAAAAGLHPSLTAASAAMHRGAVRCEPNPSARQRYDKDYEVFLEMHRQRQKLDAILARN